MFRQFCILVLLGSLPAAAGGWGSDFEAARKLAKEQGKDLLLEFTGSDWCSWCIKLRKEVFNQDAFQKAATEKFVLVELDYPKDPSKLKEQTRKQNLELADRYGIEAYPTIILADARGRPYAETGYMEGGSVPYLKHLDDLQSIHVGREKALAEAETLSGVEKAKALLRVVGDLSDSAVDEFYGDLVRQIEECDPEDQTGFRAGRQYRKAVLDYEGQIEELFGAGQFPEALAMADAFVAQHKPSGEDLQHILMAKVMAHVELKQKAEAGRVLDAVKEAAPDSELGGRVGTLRAQIEVHLKEPGGEAVPVPEPK